MRQIKYLALTTVAVAACFSPTGSRPDATATVTAPEPTSTVTATATASSPTPTGGPTDDPTPTEPGTEPTVPPVPTTSAPTQTSVTLTESGPEPTTGPTSASTSTGTSLTGPATEPETTMEIPGTCGNSVVEAGEECDDGATPGLDGCAEDCKRSALFVFVTSQVYAGDNLTLETADADCNILGASAVPPGFQAPTFRAWLSASGLNESAAARVSNPGAVPYIRLDGAYVTAAPFGPNLTNPIAVDETGADVFSAGQGCENPDSLVWTMSTPAGEVGVVCDGQTGAKGTVGSHNNVDGAWSQACTYDCGLDARLYCVEVPK